MAFRITIEPEKIKFQAEQGETLLEAALRQSVELPYGCRSGNCGSCAARIIKGEVDYESQPAALTEERRAQGEAILCKAYPRSDITLYHEHTGDHVMPVRSLRCRIEEKKQLNHDVIGLKIKLAGDERLQYLAGQYVEFILQDGRRRAFSIANAPHKDELIEFHIRHVPGGVFTDHLFEDMPDRGMLRIEGPMGSFYLREDSDRPVILMGGGTGFGPLKAIIEHAVYTGFSRPIHLYMGVRALRDLYMQDMVEGWLKQCANLRFIAVLSDALPEDNWQGETGFVHDIVARDHADLSPFDIYMSGPPPMINAALEVFLVQGAQREHMFSDAFEYSVDAAAAIAKASKKDSNS